MCGGNSELEPCGKTSGLRVRLNNETRSKTLGPEYGWGSAYVRARPGERKAELRPWLAWLMFVLPAPAFANMHSNPAHTTQG